MGSPLYIYCMMCEGPLKELDWVFCEDCKETFRYVPINKDDQLDLTSIAAARATFEKAVTYYSNQALPKITIPEDTDLDKIKAAMELYQADKNYMEVITSPYPCCPFCVEFDKLPDPIRKKILALMRVANAN